jgi:hypothetical protein
MDPEYPLKNTKYSQLRSHGTQKSFENAKFFRFSPSDAARHENYDGFLGSNDGSSQ